jgi:copper chaperone CopZ
MQNMQLETIRIRGMSCGGCVRDVQRALGQLPGVRVERVEVGRATVSFDPALSSREDIADAVRGAGYVPRWT